MDGWRIRCRESVCWRWVRSSRPPRWCWPRAATTMRAAPAASGRRGHAAGLHGPARSSATTRARRASLPGPATSRTARRTRASTGSPPSSRRPAARCSLTTFGTSDESFTKMESKEYDVDLGVLVTPRVASSTPVSSTPSTSTWRSNYDDIFDDLKDKPWNSVDVDGDLVRYGLPSWPRREPAHVQHREGEAGSHLVGAHLGGRQPLRRIGHGVRQRDLHRGRRRST